MLASEHYLLRILPAGRNDRMAEISDRSGKILKYVFCSRGQADSTHGPDVTIREDFEAMEASAFAHKYDIPSERSSGG